MTQPAGLFRRLAIIFYDGLLLCALLMTVGALWLPLNGGEAITPAQPLLYYLFRISLLLTAFAFFGGFWLFGGQTLGMRAWRVTLRDAGGGPITPRQAALRFAAAIVSWLPLGLGYLWSLIDSDKRSWHDIASATILVHQPKPRGGSTKP